MKYSENGNGVHVVSDYQDNYGSGWVKLYRSLINDKIWTSEKFTKGQAWVDLILLAKHSDGIFMQRDVIVEYKRGDVTEGVINLGKRWKWSRTKTNNFLFYLEKIQQIRQQKSNVITVISILNYDIYQKSVQQNGQQESNRRATGEQQEDTHKNVKNEKNVKYTAFPRLDEVADYAKDNNLNIDAKYYFNSREESGWKKQNGASVRNWKLDLQNAARSGNWPKKQISELVW